MRGASGPIFRIWPHAENGHISGAGFKWHGMWGALRPKTIINGFLGPKIGCRHIAAPLGGVGACAWRVRAYF